MVKPNPRGYAETSGPFVQPAGRLHRRGKIRLDDVQKTLDKLRNPPRYFANTYRSAITAPLSSIVYRQGGIPHVEPTFKTASGLGNCQRQPMPSFSRFALTAARARELSPAIDDPATYSCWGAVRVSTGTKCA